MLERRQAVLTFTLEAVVRHPVSAALWSDAIDSSIAAAAATPLVSAFTAQFPDIALNVTTDLSKYVDTRIDRSYLVNAPYVDIAILQTVHDYPRWKEEGRLLPYKPSTFDDINNAIKDLDGAYVPVNISKI